MASPRRFKSFAISEISGVDRPAQAHAKALIMKRDADPLAVLKDMNGVAHFADLIQSITYLAQGAEFESEMEGDQSPVPAAIPSAPPAEKRSAPQYLVPQDQRSPPEREQP